MSFDILLVFLSNLSWINWLYLVLFSIIILLLYQTRKSFLDELTNIIESERQIEKRLKNSHFPPFYPNGWLPVFESNQLKKGQIKPIFAFENNLVAFRAVSGKVTILDAYCPHLGANLGYGGVVIGDSIKCPFHGWTFNEKGSCTHITGIEEQNIPKIQLKVWESLEINGFVFVWNHAKGEKPNWFVPNFDQIKNDQFTFCTMLESKFEGHVQDLAENVTDIIHFHTFHDSFNGVNNKDLDNKIDDFPCNEICSAVWNEEPGPNNPTFVTHVHSTPKILELTIGSAKFLMKQIGPAFTWLEIQYSLAFNVKLYGFQAMISSGPLTHTVITHLYAKGVLGHLIGRLLIPINKFQASKNMEIWKYKKCLLKPFVAENEPYLNRFRRWYNQFYSVE